MKEIVDLKVYCNLNRIMLRSVYGLFSGVFRMGGTLEYYYNAKPKMSPINVFLSRFVNFGANFFLFTLRSVFLNSTVFRFLLQIQTKTQLCTTF